MKVKSHAYGEARDMMDAEWEHIYSCTGEELWSWLSGNIPELTKEEASDLWMEFYGIINDKTLGRFYHGEKPQY
jgi:hypothetical protein